MWSILLNVAMWALQFAFQDAARFVRQILGLPHLPAAVSARLPALEPACIMLTLLAATTACLLPRRGGRLWTAAQSVIVAVIAALGVVPVMAR
ncbi:hypothetical protein [Kitasatospora sp. GAS204B]|uniref:hypothetical protein n=1 Tax=unclassified Kitasatospora TaxID=2633591 RepID=UPI0024745CCA|nr:hypothetical protein [Kitasatospora sp. GAS204B]